MHFRTDTIHLQAIIQRSIKGFMKFFSPIFFSSVIISFSIFASEQPQSLRLASQELFDQITYPTLPDRAIAYERARLKLERKSAQ